MADAHVDAMLTLQGPHPLDTAPESQQLPAYAASGWDVQGDERIAGGKSDLRATVEYALNYPVLTS
ncbi:hypothetical protein GCM10022408_37610 [Hymenobacter fastidiosus]|uniref:Uncharacterized protein n=1 Tax=Hymenobacter fastidiosus TaxID=486264 RepID=A0ABP7T242_9BACT